MHRPISNGIVESGQGRRLPDKNPTAHNPIRVQISSPHSCPLHEDAMLSPKRSDVAVYYFPRYSGLPEVRADAFWFMPGRCIVSQAVVS